MNAIVQAALAGWQIPPWTTAGLAVIAVVAARGYGKLYRQLPDRFPPRQMAFFLGGIAVLLVALASPLEALDERLLSVHMLQHLLLMYAAPPLMLLGAPAIPLLRGLPRPLAKYGLGTLLKRRWLRRVGHGLAHPIVGFVALTAATWGWHIPAAYQLALRSDWWHGLEHCCFLSAALVFWWPVVQPWPSIAIWPRWAIVPYLLLADLQNTIFSAFLVFSERVIYPYYTRVPRLADISALNDQATAGAIMWVPASLVFLIPACMILAQALAPRLYRYPTPAAVAGKRGGHAAARG